MHLDLTTSSQSIAGTDTKRTLGMITADPTTVVHVLAADVGSVSGTANGVVIAELTAKTPEIQISDGSTYLYYVLKQGSAPSAIWCDAQSLPGQTPATATSIGGDKMSVAPADPANPIAVGTNDARVPPTPTTAGKLVYDTGAAYAETGVGTAHQVLHGAAGAPTWSAVDLASADVTGVLPAANVDPLEVPSNVQIVADAATLVAGTATVNTGITVKAGSKFLAIRNKPDATAAHWGKLSTTGAVVGAPSTGAITINSDNVADTSSVTLVIFG